MIVYRKNRGKMRALLISFLLIIWAEPLLGDERESNLFILSGQSNILGMDPEETFLPKLIDEFGKENIIVVKHGGDGQPIRRWHKQWQPLQGNSPNRPNGRGDIYDQLLVKVEQKTKGKRPATVTFVWMQGETDAMENFGHEYKASLIGLVQQLAADLGREDINVVLGRISDHDLITGKYPHWPVVRQAQVEAAEAEPYWRWVDTDQFNDGIAEDGSLLVDDLHYTPEGYALLGSRFAEEAIALIKQRKQSLPATDGGIVTD